ncbi:MAG: hypothetical protein Q7K35_00350 [bacterium]|nr:hypothetical protein [bacterium]
MAKKLTINDLGLMVKQGFDAVDKRFDKVDNRLEDIDKKIAELRRDMDEVKLKFAYTAWAIDVEELKKRVIILEQKLNAKK